MTPDTASPTITPITRTSARLADGREIVYFDETPDTDRVLVDRRDLPRVIPGSQVRYDALTGENWLHLEVFSIRRAVGKLKFLAGSESAMGAFVNDITPEVAAQRLRDVGQVGR